MPARTELATGVLLNEDMHILLLRSSKHGQWELPGSKVRRFDDMETPRIALRRAFYEKLGCRIDADESALMQLRAVRFKQGEVDYVCHRLQVVHFEGELALQETCDYDAMEYINPLKRRPLAGEMSPNVLLFLDEFNKGDIALRRNSSYPVQ